MKLLKKIAAFLFGKKRTAQKQGQPEYKSSVFRPKQTSPERACKVVECGKSEVPLFYPQTLMTFYGMYKAMQTQKPVSIDISQVQVLNLFNPLNSEFIATVFAIKDEKGLIWGKIATSDIYFSEDDAFMYDKAKVFRIPLCPQKRTRIMAVCSYKKGKVVVNQLLEETLTPPTDNDREKIIDCPLVPCGLDKAAEFAQKL